MTVTKEEICQHALVLIGAQPISSFDDGSTEATACENMYENTVQDALSTYRWRFAIGMEQMSRLVDAPLTKWDAAYQIPTTCLWPLTCYINSSVIDFDRYEDMIFCDATSSDEVILEYVARVDEQFWPPYFTQYIIHLMAAQLALSIAMNESMAQSLNSMAAQKGSIARNRDAMGRTAPNIKTTRLINSRFRRSGYLRTE